MSRTRTRRLPGRPRAYDVGYGKPPSASRFKKGQSGNPRGRPRGAKANTPARPTERLNDILLEEASRLITVPNGDRTMTLSMMQAASRTLAIDAVKGKPRAQRFLIENVTAIERDRNAQYDVPQNSHWLQVRVGTGTRAARTARHHRCPTAPAASRSDSAQPASQHRADRGAGDEGGEGGLRSVGRTAGRAGDPGDAAGSMGRR